MTADVVYRAVRPLARRAAGTGHVPGLLDLRVPGEWVERALCAETDPEVFFPEKGGSTKQAKQVCAGCEVRSECLLYALERHEPHGVWGGLSQIERRKLHRRGAA